MNETIQQPQLQTPPEPIPQAPKPTGMVQFAKDFYAKLRSNKKIFWLVIILFSLIILIIIAGIIFRLAGGSKQTTKITATPTPKTQVVAPEEKKEPLDLAKEELESIDKRIKEFDISQKKLQSPAVNFDIQF